MSWILGLGGRSSAPRRSGAGAGLSPNLGRNWDELHLSCSQEVPSWFPTPVIRPSPAAPVFAVCWWCSCIPGVSVIKEYSLTKQSGYLRRFVNHPKPRELGQGVSTAAPHHCFSGASSPLELKSPQPVREERSPSMIPVVSES